MKINCLMQMMMSTIADLSVPSEDEEEEVKSNNIWEHAIDILFRLSPTSP